MNTPARRCLAPISRIVTCISLGLIFICRQSNCADLTINFGAVDTNVPYAEAGLLFTASNGFAGIRGTPNDYLTIGGSFISEVRLHVSASNPFDLLSLNIIGTNLSWHIETSAGGVFDINRTGIVTLPSTQAYEDLTSFDVVTAGPLIRGALVNALLSVDDIVVRPAEMVPALQIAQDAGSTMLRWPASATNFVLEAAEQLSPTAPWQTVTNVPAQADGMFSLTIGQRSAGFFRLKNAR